MKQDIASDLHCLSQRMLRVGTRAGQKAGEVASIASVTVMHRPRGRIGTMVFCRDLHPTLVVGYCGCVPEAVNKLVAKKGN